MPEAREYTQALNSVLAKYGGLENETIQRVLSVLEQSQKEILLRLSRAKTQTEVAAVMRDFDLMLPEIERQLSHDLTTQLKTAFSVGEQSVISPLAALGVGGVPNIIAPSQAAVIENFAASLVKDITEPMRNVINQNVKQAAMGLINAQEAMAKISDALGSRGGKQISTGVTAKAESVVRTEMQRIFNSANHQQMMALAERIPGLMKRWIATADGRTRRGHLEIHLKTKDHPIPVMEPYRVRDWRHTKKRGWYVAGTAELMFPGDPTAPPAYTVNCRCTQTLIHPAAGVIGSTLDARVAAMMKNHEKEGK